MSDNMSIKLPDGTFSLTPGCRVKIGRFSRTTWLVKFGWYRFSGNREICGWYLVNCETSEVRPLQRIDLSDIYLIQRA